MKRNHINVLDMCEINMLKIINSLNPKLFTQTEKIKKVELRSPLTLETSNNQEQTRT